MPPSPYQKFLYILTFQVNNLMWVVGVLLFSILFTLPISPCTVSSARSVGNVSVRACQASFYVNIATTSTATFIQHVKYSGFGFSLWTTWRWASKEVMKSFEFFVVINKFVVVLNGKHVSSTFWYLLHCAFIYFINLNLWKCTNIKLK